MSSGDDWANFPAACTVASRSAAREQLAREMAEFEAKHGPVETTPIIVRRDFEKPKITTLAPFMRDTLSGLQKGHTAIADLIAYLNQPSDRVWHALNRLIKRGLAIRVAHGVYHPAEVKSND